MYQPTPKLLKKYADILVKFALNSGDGVKKGEVVQCVVPDVAKPMLVALQASILEAGAHPLMRMLPTGLDKPFYDLANDEQLTFFPKQYLQARVKLIDHTINIIAEHDLRELKNVDPRKIVKATDSKKKIRQWLTDKEYAGKFTWTIALYATPAMAKEAGMSLAEYWQQIIQACFLDFDDPIEQWKKVNEELERLKKTMNALPIDRLHVVGKRIDLWLTLGKKRRFVAGSGRNIPSFELFTSPDWRGTNGYIEFNQPLYRYGTMVSGIRLEFKDGRVIKGTAREGQQLLTEMLKRKDADKVGEFSLTDSRFSRITKFMADTLFDENMGGKYGNTHIAIGMSYQDAFDGDPRVMSKKDFDELGFNNVYCAEHCDMISTEDRTVTAILKDGSEKVIYKDGKFTV